MPKPSASQIMNVNKVHRKNRLQLTLLRSSQSENTPLQRPLKDSLTTLHCTVIKQAVEFLGYSSYLPSE